jgi:glycosyltransferase involved in cell wall biosynthesis
MKIAERPQQPSISIVIPAKNEARNLAEILPELPPVHEVILVDGHSVDDTVATAQRVMPGIKVVQQTRKGKGNALVCGFAAATGDVIVMFDADGSADPAEIADFVAALTAGADFAKGSRFCAGGGSHDITRLRSAGNKVFNTMANAVLHTKYTDLCYGYNAFWADILPTLDLPDHRISPIDGAVMLWGDGFEIETVLNCRIAFERLNVAEVSSVERLRIHGESNLNAWTDGIRILKTIWSEQRRAAGRRRVSKTPMVIPVPEPRPAGLVAPPAIPTSRPAMPTAIPTAIPLPRNHLDSAAELSAESA